MKEKYVNKLVCRRGLNDIWINEATGEVRMCGWSNFFIGSLLENSIEEIWHGELAEKFRESMRDGSYRYCNHSICPHCANDRLDELMVEYDVPEYPSYCSLSYQLQCNYACKFCRAHHYVACDCEKENYIKIEEEVRKIIPHLETLSSNGAGEFFCSSSIIRLIQEEKLNNSTKIILETNGSLFNEENWSKISKLGEHDLTVAVTVHSFNNDTYQYLSGTTLPVEQVISNLKYISQLRKQNIVNKFEIATVICERNFREMPEFVKRCLEDFEMDTIRLRFFEPYGVMDVNTEWLYDVRNVFHPYHDEFEKIMSDEIFNNPKVWKWQGNTASLQRENPYVLEHRNAVACAKLQTMEDGKEKIDSYCKENGVRTIAIYGASEIGKSLAQTLGKYGKKVNVFFDTFAAEYEDTVNIVSRPQEDKLAEFDMILISSLVYEVKIKEELERRQFKGIVMTVSKLVEQLDLQQL